MIVNKHANRESLTNKVEVNPVPSFSIFILLKGVNIIIKILKYNNRKINNYNFEYAKEGPSTIEMVRMINSNNRVE